MRHHLTLIRQDPTLRLLCLLALLFGIYMASLGPYQSLLAIRVFGLSDSTYALVLLASLAMSVGAAVGIGIITDQRPSRRIMALAASAALVIGAALVWAEPSGAVFVLAHVLFFPVAGTVFGQIFAVARLVSTPFPAPDRDAVLAIIRSLLALPFVVILPLWGAAFERGLHLGTIYPALVLIGLAMMGAVIWRWPADTAAPWVEQKSGLGFRASLAEMVAGPVFLRVLLVGALHSGGMLAGIIVGLSFAQAGLGAGPVGVFFGLFVAIEIITTLLIGTFVRYLPRLTLIALGSYIYAVFLILLPVLVASPQVWLLVLPAGIGGGLMYALALGYLQDLLGKRAGAGASLLALGRISQDLLCAGVFALGTWISGYGLVAVLGGLGVALAMSALLWLDRHRPL